MLFLFNCCLLLSYILKSNHVINCLSIIEPEDLYTDLVKDLTEEMKENNKKLDKWISKAKNEHEQINKRESNEGINYFYECEEILKMQDHYSDTLDRLFSVLRRTEYIDKKLAGRLIDDAQDEILTSLEMRLALNKLKDQCDNQFELE